MGDIRAMFKEKKIMCDECLSEFEWDKRDLYGDLDEIYVTCPFCDAEVEIYDIEDYGIWPDDLFGGEDE
jgi:hypothetical protein